MNPHAIRAGLFDVDGTILSFATHEVSRATREALVGMRANGIATILATGRPSYQLEAVPLELFDAVVSFNGQLCRLADGTVIREELIDPHDVEAFVEDSERSPYPALFQTREKIFLSYRDKRVRALEDAIDFRYVVDDPRVALECDVFQVNAFVPAEHDHRIMEHVPGLKCLRWSPIFADIVPVGGGKDVGIRAVLSCLGIDAADAVCFGDGENDIPMLDICGHAVVMGSASDVVKAHATLVTEDVEREGVARACEALGLV